MNSSWMLLVIERARAALDQRDELDDQEQERDQAEDGIALPMASSRPQMFTSASLS
jgi:hypothetical protein